MEFKLSKRITAVSLGIYKQREGYVFTDGEHAVWLTLKEIASIPEVRALIDIAEAYAADEGDEQWRITELNSALAPLLGGKDDS